MQTLTDHRLARVKPSFASRRIAPGAFAALDGEAGDLAPGDVVLARVEEIGHHTRIERPDGRRAILFPGDELLLACGARYAPDQFEADCPTAVGPAHLAAAGGIAGIVCKSHARMKPPTRIAILGAALDARGRRLRLADRAVAPPSLAPPRIPVVAVCGTSMNSGKTHAVASLVRGLSLAGLKVAAIKATGTGAGGDLWLFHDSGAVHVADFTDAGFATTYRADPAAILAGIERLLGDAALRGAEIVVMEIADGLGQAETAALLAMPAFRALPGAMIFAASDAMGAAAGLDWLARKGHRPAAVSGLLAASPLALAETRALTPLPCLTAEALMNPETALALFGPQALTRPGRPAQVTTNAA